MKVEVNGNPYRVNFMAVHPLTGELLFDGDVIHVPDMVVAYGIEDGLFTRLPDGVDENRIPRGEPSKILGFNTDMKTYEAQQLLSAMSDVLPAGFLAKEMAKTP